MAMGDPANEPNNPDGCQIDKASIKKATSSLARLSAVFIRTAAIIESSVRQMVQSIRAVGKVKVKGGGGGGGEGGGGGGKIELPFNMKIWENTRKKAKKQERDAIRFRKKMAKLDAKAAKDREKAERKAIENEESEIISNAKKLLTALNKKNDTEEREIEKNAIKGLSARNAANREEEKIVSNARRMLTALNKKKFKKEEKTAEQERKEIERNAMAGLRARNAIRLAQEKEQEARTKFFSDQEKEITKKAPFAYGIGKALGFLSAKLFKIISSSAPKVVEGVKGLFSSQDENSEEINKKREERAKRKRIIDPLAVREEEYKKGIKLKKFKDRLTRKRMSGDGGESKAFFATGGEAKGTDTVPAMLTPGEFVVSKKAAQQNRGELEAMNQGKKKKRGYYAAGGLVAAGARAISGAATGASAAGRGLAAGAESAGFTNMANTINTVVRAMGPLKTGFDMLNMAVLGPVDLFNQLIGAVGPFVQAVNPALMQQLSMAFKDLQAVIGVALQPVIAAAVPIVRAFADRLMPVAQALIPAFEQFALSMSELAGPVIEILAEAFASLEPIIATVSALIESWGAILSLALPAIIGVIKSFVTGITLMVNAVIYAVGWIMSWFPKIGDTGKKMMESSSKATSAVFDYAAGTSKAQQALKEPIKKNAAAGAAARGASFSGISDFGKNLMKEAFSSSTQVAAEKTAEYTKKTYEEIAKLNVRQGQANPAAPAAGVRRGVI